jgi:hypothetical protein
MEIPPQGEMIGPLVSGLATALVARGLAAESVGTHMVWAINRAADGDDPVGAAMSPGLRQAVVCRPDEDGRSM